MVNCFFNFSIVGKSGFRCDVPKQRSQIVATYKLRLGQSAAQWY